MRIALVEDDPQLGPLVRAWLIDAGHHCELFPEARALRRAATRESFDLLILDRMLPDESGDSLLVWLLEHSHWKAPVIIVSRRDNEDDVVTGLQLGADDYIAKPLKRRELLARVAAVARRASGAISAPGPGAEAAPYGFDLAQRMITLRGSPIDLTTREFDLAVFLFRNAGRPVSRTHILSAVWGQEADVNTRTIDTHVSRLRSKLAIGPRNGWRLNSVYQYGYRLDPLPTGMH